MSRPATSSGDVLVPRDGPWGDEVAEGLRARGLTPRIVPLIRTETCPSDDLRAAQRQAAGGGLDWVVLTSAAAVPSLPARVATRIAVVGRGTERAVRAAGHDVAHVPAVHDVQGLLDEGVLAGNILVLRSDLAGPRLAQELTRRGHTVTDVIAYRTLPVRPAEADLRDLAGGAFRAALLSSGSVVRSLVRFPVHERTAFIALGPQTEAAAHEAGLPVHAVAEERSAAALVEAAAQHLTRSEKP